MTLSTSIAMALLFLAARVEARCPLPNSWIVTANCPGGSATHAEDEGILLRCPNGIPANSVGVRLESQNAFGAIAHGAAELNLFQPGTGGAAYAAVQLGADDAASLDVRLENTGSENNVIGKLKSATGDEKDASEEVTPSEDDALTVDVLRHNGAQGPKEISVEVHSYGTTFNLTSTDWSSAGYKIAVTLGNSAATAVTGNVQVHIESLTDNDGARPLKTLALCTLAGIDLAPSDEGETGEPSAGNNGKGTPANGGNPGSNTNGNNGGGNSPADNANGDQNNGPTGPAASANVVAASASVALASSALFLL